jgi:VanZ family protein
LAPPDFLAKHRVAEAKVKAREAGHARLVNHKGGASLFLAQEIIPGSDIADLRVTVEARAVNISTGDKPWHCGRLVLTPIAEASNSPDYNLPHELFCLNGDYDWQLYSKVFHVYPGVERLLLQVQLHQVTGSLELSRLSVRAVAEKRAWPFIQVIMIGAFMLYLGWTFSLYCRQGQFGYTLFAALCGVLAIAILTSIPLSLKSQIYQLVLPLVSKVPSVIVSSAPVDAGGIVGGVSTKFFWLMHYAIFAATTVLLLLAISDRSVQARLFDLLMLAIATEGVQAFVRDRSASMSGVAVDTLGIATGFLLWLVITRRKSRVLAR